MGVDVTGMAPTAEVGVSFRSNLWRWRPLTEYVAATFPDIAGSCEDWTFNVDAGLDAGPVRELGEAIKADIAAGPEGAATKWALAYRDYDPEDMDTWYEFTLEITAEFAEFLCFSGGFEIR